MCSGGEFWELSLGLGPGIGGAGQRRGEEGESEGGNAHGEDMCAYSAVAYRAAVV